MIDPAELSAKKIYDGLATTYSLGFEANFIQYLKYQLLQQFVTPTSVCLDIGGANGVFIIPLSGKVKEVHSIDISPVMLAECRKNLDERDITNVHLYQRSATKLLFDDNFFDVVFSYSTLSLVPNPERAYKEIVRVLKPGGLAILDITGKFNLSQYYWARYYRRHGHFGLNAYSLPEIRAIFRALNLEIIETYATGLLDQWKYVPLLRKAEFLEKVFHTSSCEPDLDYKISQRIPWLANRWYFVLKNLK